MNVNMAAPRPGWAVPHKAYDIFVCCHRECQPSRGSGWHNMLYPVSQCVTGLSCVLWGGRGRMPWSGCRRSDHHALHGASHWFWAPESLDLTGLLRTNSVTGMRFGKQSLRMLSDSHAGYFFLNYLNAVVDASSSICCYLWVSSIKKTNRALSLDKPL